MGWGWGRLDGSGSEWSDDVGHLSQRECRQQDLRHKAWFNLNGVT